MQPPTTRKFSRKRKSSPFPSAGATSSQSPTTNKNHQITTTTETLATPSTGDSPLPFHLIKEILCRLPVKFLIQFQCVCKSWKSLISNDYKFAKKHLHMSLNFPRQGRHHLIQESMDGKLWDSLISSFSNAVSDAFIAQTKLRYPPILDAGFSQPVGSCHGIVCFKIPHFVVFWNPSIGKFKISPVLEKSSPWITSMKYGFGYDHSNDNYKMVTISSCDDPKTELKTLVNVHTLGTNCWRRIQDFPCGVPVCELGTFVGGTLNWVVRENPKIVKSRLFVVSLDLGNESYQEILQPDYGEVKLIGLTLGEFRDCLCIFANSSKLTVDVWIMNEYGKKDSWNKLFTIPHIEDLGRPAVNFSRYINVVFIYEDEQVLLVSRSFFKPKLLVYDSKSDTFKIPKTGNFTGRDPTIYVESLMTTCY